MNRFGDSVVEKINELDKGVAESLQYMHQLDEDIDLRAIMKRIEEVEQNQIQLKGAFINIDTRLIEIEGCLNEVNDTHNLVTALKTEVDQSLWKIQKLLEENIKSETTLTNSLINKLSNRKPCWNLLRKISSANKESN